MWLPPEKGPSGPTPPTHLRCFCWLVMPTCLGVGSNSLSPPPTDSGLGVCTGSRAGPRTVFGYLGVWPTNRKTGSSARWYFHPEPVGANEKALVRKPSTSPAAHFRHGLPLSGWETTQLVPLNALDNAGHLRGETTKKKAEARG